jgi:hypothetical protein
LQKITKRFSDNGSRGRQVRRGVRQERRANAQNVNHTQKQKNNFFFFFFFSQGCSADQRESSACFGSAEVAQPGTKSAQREKAETQRHVSLRLNKEIQGNSVREEREDKS